MIGYETDIFIHLGHNASGKVIVWSFVLMAILILGFVAVSKAKRRLRSDDHTETGVTSGFTLSDLRQMHRNGQLSDVEFERAKAKIVEAARKAADRLKKDQERGSGRDKPQI